MQVPAQRRGLQRTLKSLRDAGVTYLHGGPPVAPEIRKWWAPCGTILVCISGVVPVQRFSVQRGLRAEIFSAAQPFTLQTSKQQNFR